MKVSNIFKLFFAGLLPLLGACADQLDAPTVSEKHLISMTFEATASPGVGSNGGTRTVVHNETSPYTITWQSRDKISIFDANSTSAIPKNYPFVTDQEGPVAIFNGEAPASTQYYAIYPHDFSNSLADGKLEFQLLSHQRLYDNKIADGTNIEVAKADGKNLHFQNACHYYKLGFYFGAGITKDIKAIYLIANNDADGKPVMLSGRCSVSLPTVDGPQEDLTGSISGYNATNYIRLARENDRLFFLPSTQKTPHYYYVMLPAVNLEKGYALHFLATDSTVCVKEDNLALNMKAGHVTPVTWKLADFKQAYLKNVPLINIIEASSGVSFANKTPEGYVPIYDNLTQIDKVKEVEGTGDLARALRNFSELEYYKNLSVFKLDSANLLTQRDLDLTHNAKLVRFDMKNTNLNTINASNLPELKTIECVSNSSLTALNTTGSTELLVLRAEKGRLASVDLSTNTKLERITVNENNLTQLNLENNPLLTYVHCSRNPLGSIDVSHQHLLASLKCEYNNLTALNVSTNPELTYLSCSFNNLQSLDVSNNIKLEHLDVQDNKNMTQLTGLERMTSLMVLYIYDTHLSGDWNLNYLKNTLQNLGTSQTYLTSLDISECTKITSGTFGNLRTGRYLELKCTDVLWQHVRTYQQGINPLGENYTGSQLAASGYSNNARIKRIF